MGRPNSGTEGVALQPSEADPPSPRKHESSVGDGHLLLSPGTPWNFLGVRLQRFPSWQEHRGHACVPASSVYQLSGKHSVWFQKDCCQLGRKVNRVKPKDCLGGGRPVRHQSVHTRQTTTLPAQVPAPLWNSEVKALSLATEERRESSGYTQQTHKFTVRKNIDATI